MKTIQQITSQIIRLSHTGREFQINESLHFGVGLYVYQEDARGLNVPCEKSDNNLFVRLENDAIMVVLTHLLERDGYLTLS